MKYEVAALEANEGLSQGRSEFKPTVGVRGGDLVSHENYSSILRFIDGPIPTVFILPDEPKLKCEIAKYFPFTKDVD